MDMNYEHSFIIGKVTFGPSSIYTNGVLFVDALRDFINDIFRFPFFSTKDVDRLRAGLNFLLFIEKENVCFVKYESMVNDHHCVNFIGIWFNEERTISS
jgi:hypothetical protein